MVSARLNIIESGTTFFAARKVFFMQLLFSFCFAFALFSQNLSAKFGLIDDHTIMGFMGEVQKIELAEIPKLLLESEAGRPTASTRYRPAYWFLRLMETTLWGNNPYLWYLSRIFIFSVAFLVTWHLLSGIFGYITSGLGCMIMFSHPFWSDIFARLGPSETYGVLGLTLFAFAGTMIWNQSEGEKDVHWWFLLAIGNVIAMGSKENFLFLLPLSCLLIYRTWRRKSLKVTTAVLFFLQAIIGLLIMSIVFVMTQKAGRDIYANPTNIVDRFGFLYDVFSFSHWQVKLPLFFSIIFFFVGILVNKFSSRHRSDKFIDYLTRLVMAELVLLGLWYSQYFFYSGKWPRGMRYDFPGVLAVDLGYLFLAYPIFAISRERANSIGTFCCRKLKYVVPIILFFLLAHPGVAHIKAVRLASEKNVKKTRIFQEELHSVVREVREKPDIPIIFVVHHPWDWEPAIRSLRYYFLFHRISNPLCLQLQGFAKNDFASGTMEKGLAQDMERRSKEGDNGRQFDIRHVTPFSPLQSCNNSEQSFIIDFMHDSREIHIALRNNKSAS